MAGARRSCLTIRFIPRGATPRFAVVRDGSFQCGSQSCTEKMLFLAAKSQYKFRMGQYKSRIAQLAVLGRVPTPKQTFTLPIPGPSRRQEVPLVRVGVIGGLDSAVDITCQPRRAVLLFESLL